MKTKGYIKSSIRLNETYKAEPREVKLRRILAGESSDLEDNVFPIVYTNRDDGVMPAYDIRTDRFEVALEAVDKIGKAEAAKIAKRKESTNKDQSETSKVENAVAPMAGQS